MTEDGSKPVRITEIYICPMELYGNEFLTFDLCICDGSFSAEVCRPPSGQWATVRVSAIEAFITGYSRSIQ